MARNSGKVIAETGLETWATWSPSERDTLVPTAAFFFLIKALRSLLSALTSSKPAARVYTVPSNEFKVAWMLESCWEASCSWQAVWPSWENSETSSCTHPEHFLLNFPNVCSACGRLQPGQHLVQPICKRQMYENRKNNTTWQITNRTTRAVTKLKPITVSNKE